MAPRETFVPNLIVLGTPKSGTTSLHEWLIAHPDVGHSPDKEVRFLLDPEDPLSRADSYANTGLEGYGKRFPDHLKSQRSYWIDSSPTYYYQRCALDVIGSLENKPFLGLLYRRPGARIYSYYQYAMHNRTVLPRDMDFEAFLKAVEEGPSGPLRNTPGLSNMFEHSDYAKYTQLWLDRVPRDRFFFLRFEDVTQRPAETLRQLCGRFGLDASFYDTYDFPQENRSYYVRNPGLHGLMRRTAQILTLPKPVRRAIRSVYERVNTSELRKEKDDRTTQLIADLDRRFAPTVARLEDIIGLDLSAWRP